MRNLAEVEREINESQKKFDRITFEMDTVLKKIKSLEQSVKDFDGRIAELRMRRQEILALGEEEKVAEITRLITAERERGELQEDELIGLRTRLKKLREERDGIRTVLDELKKERAVLESVPLVKKYNEVASDLASVANQLFEKLRELGESVEGNRIFRVSTVEAFRVVPRLYFLSEAKDGLGLKDFIRLW